MQLLATNDLALVQFIGLFVVLMWVPDVSDNIRYVVIAVLAASIPWLSIV